MVIEHDPVSINRTMLRMYRSPLERVFASNIFVEKHDPSFIMRTIGYHKRYRVATQCITIQTGESWTAEGRGRTGDAAVATNERERQIQMVGLASARWRERRLASARQRDGGDGGLF
ncbi:hypothetical protein Syun_009322 [Stephania yunnanensis]|uniref:Uncharacterized protein n=1 Tax=Stephania yunnanensis TaxID=152371 RepID=A0AAP0PNE9_9MAGN